MYFHVRDKGNENVLGLARGLVVKYSKSRIDKGVCAENVSPIAGVCVYLRSCVLKRQRDRESERARAHTHTGTHVPAHMHIHTHAHTHTHTHKHKNTDTHI